MRAKDYVLLGLFCLVLYGYSWVSGRALTMHESRLPQNARQMLCEGNWVLPMSGERPWLERPPLPNWCVMVSDWVFRRSNSMAVVRVPSGVMGTIVVLLAAWVTAKWFGRGMGIVAGLVLATSYEFYLFSCRAEDDIYLAGLVMGCVTLFVGERWGTFREELREDASGEGRGLGEVGQFEKLRFWGWRGWKVLAFFVLLGVSNLAKGPLVGTAEVGVTIGAYVLWSRDWRTLRKYLWLWGILIFAALALWWPIAAYRRFPDVWDNWLFDYQNRGTGPSDYREPVWYYGLTMLWVMLPWTPAMLIGLWDCFKEARRRDAFVEKFLICWALGPIVVMSIPARKHHHYLVPMLAPWAILAARGLVPIAKELTAGKGPAWIRSPLFGALAVGLPGAIALVMLRHKLPGPAWGGVMLAGVWMLAVMIWYVGGWKKNAGVMLAAVVFGLSVGYCWGQSVIPEAGDNALGDVAFLEKVRKAVPGDKPLVINAHVGTLEFFRNQFYLREDAVLVHNLSYLRDERIRWPEVYLITRFGDAEKLAQLGEAEVVVQSEKGHREKSPKERFTLFRLRFKPDLVRYPATQPIGVLQGLERAPGPWLGSPL